MVSPSINSLVENAERFCFDAAIWAQRLASGLKPLSSEAVLCDTHSALDHAEVLPYLDERALGTTDALRKARLATLRSFIAAFRLRHTCAPAQDALRHTLNTHSVASENTTMTLGEALAFGHRDSDSNARNALFSQAATALRANDFAFRQFIDEQARSVATNSIFLPEPANDSFNQLLDDAYGDVLGHGFKKTNQTVSGDQYRLFDVMHVLEAPWLSEFFPKRDLFTALNRWLLELGFDPYAQGKITLDQNPQSTVADAHVFGVTVPSDIRLILKQRHGLSAYSGWLFNWGIALSQAHTTETLPFVERTLGDAANSVTLGRLFSLLLTDEHWLKRYLKVPSAVAREAARMAALREVFLIRAAALDLTLQRLWATQGTTAHLGRDYVERVSAQLSIRVEPEFAALTQSADAAASKLDAVTLEAAWFEALRSRFNEDWWRNPSASTWLRQAAGVGRLQTAVSRAATLSQVDHCALAARRLVTVLGA